MRRKKKKPIEGCKAGEESRDCELERKKGEESQVCPKLQINPDIAC